MLSSSKLAYKPPAPPFDRDAGLALPLVGHSGNLQSVHLDKGFLMGERGVIISPLSHQLSQSNGLFPES
jgi:hypothetical protein